MPDNQSDQAINSPEFKVLEKNRRQMSFLFTFLILTIYFGFILLIAFNKEVLKGHTGIFAAAGIIIGSWILTGIYIWWANSRYDQQKQAILKKYFQ